jgi:hypothetical protein
MPDPRCGSGPEKYSEGRLLISVRFTDTLMRAKLSEALGSQESWESALKEAGIRLALAAQSAPAPPQPMAMAYRHCRPATQTDRHGQTPHASRTINSHRPAARRSSFRSEPSSPPAGAAHSTSPRTASLRRLYRTMLNIQIRHWYHARSIVCDLRFQRQGILAQRKVLVGIQK